MGGKKKEKMKDLRAAAIKDEQLKELQNIVTAINKLQFDIGQMEVQKHTALDEMKKTQNKVGDMQNLLLREYGSYDVNINDGTINWPKAESNGVDKPEDDEK